MVFSCRKPIDTFTPVNDPSRVVVRELLASPLPAPDLHQRLLAASLPSPPQTLLALLTRCQSDDTGITELAELIGHDPALTAKVLAVAHSAAFHARDGQMLTLAQACQRLGTALIKVLVISESVLQTYGVFSRSINADLRPFWTHSLRVAVIARELAKQTDYRLTEFAYLSGLLHDVGRLALLMAAKAELGDLFDAPDDDTLCVREQGRVGMSHVQAGTWLLRRWHLDPVIVESIGQHHDGMLTDDPTPALPRLLQIAHGIVDLTPEDGDPLTQWAERCAWRADQLRSVLYTAGLQVEQIGRDLGLELNTVSSAPDSGTSAPVAIADTNSKIRSDVAFDRSVFNEMTMALMGKHNLHATLTSMREYASALLQLDVSVVMLLRETPRVLVTTSQGDHQPSAGATRFEIQTHAPLAACVDSRSVVFTSRDDPQAAALHQFVDAREVVLIPLLTSQKVLGVLMATLPADLGDHLKHRLPMLQAFGVYAGLALARRHQADKLRRAQLTVAQQESRLELLRISHDVRQLIENNSAQRQWSPPSPVDLSGCVRDVVQLLQASQLVNDGVQIRSQFADRATWVQGSADMVKQIVHILLMNASKAMPDGGEVRVAVGALVQHQGTVYTVLSISDQSTETATHAVHAELYEPVVGSNISEAHPPSLSIVNYLVEKMTGQIRVRTSEFGTRFEVLLPCSRPQANAICYGLPDH